MAFKLNNPFTKNNDERSGNSLGVSVPGVDKIMTNFRQNNDERSAQNRETVENLLESESNKRGNSAYANEYNRLHHNAVSPVTPVFENSKDKDYPYLMSVYNMDRTKLMALQKPDRCSDPETDAKSGSHFCNEYWQNEYKLRTSLAGTERGLLKDMENDAKVSSEMMGEILSLSADEDSFKQRAFDIIQKYKPNFKLGLNGAYLDEKAGMKNVAWQTEQNLETLLKIHDQAVAAQDAADRLKQNEYKFNKTLRDNERFMDDFNNQ